MITDDELVSGVVSGNREMECAFYEEYSKLIFNYISFTYGNTEYVEDDVSDIMIKVFTNLDKFDSTKSNLSTWVTTISRNYMIDKWRKTSRTSVGIVGLNRNTTQHLGNSEIDYTTTISSCETTNALEFLANQVSTSDYNLLTMKYLWGYSYKEIGDELGLTSSTVSNKVNYIKTKLKDSNIELSYMD